VRAVGYTRVSLEEQAREGVSLAAQAEKVAAYATITDLELVEVIEDPGFTGKNLKRPGLQRVLELVRRGEVGAVVVLKLDRLSRRTIDTLSLIEEFDRLGIQFHSIRERVDTSTAIGRFFLTIVAAFAQMEREAIGERTRDVLRHLKKNGRAYSRPVYGYVRRGDRIVPKPEEQKIIELMLRLREAGQSYGAIATELTDRGVPSKRGGRWNPATVRNIIIRRQQEQEKSA